MVKLTLELDFESESDLLNSFLWGNILSKAVGFDKCISFKTEADAPEWFGEVRWCDEDIANELECLSYPRTPEAVAIVKADLNVHWFADHLIGMGFEYMDEIIHTHHDELLALDKED